MDISAYCCPYSGLSGLDLDLGPRPTKISADEVKSMLADTKEAPVSAWVGFAAWERMPS